MMGKLDKTKDYFPLSVEFIDKLYAGGLIKGVSGSNARATPPTLPFFLAVSSTVPFALSFLPV